MSESNRAPLLDSTEQCRECVFKLGIIFFWPSTTHFDDEGEKGEGGREIEILLSMIPMIIIMIIGIVDSISLSPSLAFFTLVIEMSR